jgi:hypothetical protein
MRRRLVLRTVSFLTEQKNNRAQECAFNAERARNDAGPAARWIVPLE